MNASMLLPNLLIIGAAKAGTTSLHYYLGLHPEIAMSATKELRFFSHEESWSRGVDWYRSHFTREVPVRGESSPSYTQWRRFPKAPARIHQLMPDAKLIYLVRDPVERLLSHYAFSVAKGRERGTLEQAVRADDSRYVDCSQYFTQLSKYLELFDRSRILAVASEDLRARQPETLARIFQFLDVDATFQSPDFARTFNEVGEYRLRTPAGRRIEQLNRLGVVRAVPLEWRMAVSRWIYRPFSRPASKPTLDARLRRVLVDRLRDDVARFREWSGEPFEAWDV